MMMLIKKLGQPSYIFLNKFHSRQHIFNDLVHFLLPIALSKMALDADTLPSICVCTVYTSNSYLVCPQRWFLAEQRWVKHASHSGWTYSPRDYWWSIGRKSSFHPFGFATRQTKPASELNEGNIYFEIKISWIFSPSLYFPSFTCEKIHFWSFTANSFGLKP
jgi:hypothetical protein